VLLAAGLADAGAGLLATDEAATASFPILPALIVIPVITAIVIGLLPSARADYLKLAALTGSTITGALSAFLLVDFEVANAGFQFTVHQEWVSSLGLSWFLGVDGISLFLVVLTGLLFPVAILTSEPHNDPKPYYLWLMLLMAGSMGAFMALDLLLFFLFFEVVLVPMYFLIGGWGHEARVYAAMKFFLYTMAASALMLVGIVSVVFLTARETGITSFDVTFLAEAQVLSDTAALLVFCSFAVAFAVKVPLFPVHTWLPDAHTEAPTAGSVILAGVMLKLGTYGFIRFGVYLFPSVVDDLAPIFLTLGVVGIIYGAAVATMQRDLKRLVAYSSVAHMGFIVLGIFALNTQGLEGGVLQMVNHGISTGALFILVGWIYERRHTRQISALMGLQKAAPIFAGVFTLVMLSSIGVPGLNGFVGEFLILMGAFASARWWAVVAAVGVILAAIYLLWAYQRVFHGPIDEDNEDFRELRWTEGLVIAPLLFLIVFLGVYPKPVLERIEPSVAALVAHIEESVPGFSETTGPEPTEDVDLVEVEVPEEGHGDESEHHEDEMTTDEGATSEEEQE
jgi:NADH-quinone oxidoreductase subunit M